MLKLLCFELFINAKKNQYYSLNGKFNNEINLNYERVDNKLVIQIYNTGRKLTKTELLKLNSTENLKGFKFYKIRYIYDKITFKGI